MHHFYKEDLENNAVLGDEEFQHCVHVLRHKVGDHLVLTNGKGMLATAKIKAISKKMLDFEITEVRNAPQKAYQTHLFIGPTKQMERMEWMVEKVAELGVDHVTFLLTQNAERRKLRLDRLRKKAISALKQSKGAYLLTLHDQREFEDCFEGDDKKVIAYVDDQLPHITAAVPRLTDISLFIGPEGDFTEEEVKFAKDRGAHCVGLGPSVLRTETAGIVACCAIHLINNSEQGI
ncbi:MAG: RsmE family RNA methyltransferase [Bacteroidota bacterium]